VAGGQAQVAAEEVGAEEQQPVGASSRCPGSALKLVSWELTGQTWKPPRPAISVSAAFAAAAEISAPAATVSSNHQSPGGRRAMTIR
jgi:hypothetical protein